MKNIYIVIIMLFSLSSFAQTHPSPATIGNTTVTYPSTIGADAGSMEVVSAAGQRVLLVRQDLATGAEIGATGAGDLYFTLLRNNASNRYIFRSEAGAKNLMLLNSNLSWIDTDFDIKTGRHLTLENGDFTIRNTEFSHDNFAAIIEQRSTIAGATRHYIMPNGAIANGSLGASLKVFTSDFQADQVNYNDIGINAFAGDAFLINSKNNGSNPDLPIWISFDDVDRRVQFRRDGSVQLVESFADTDYTRTNTDVLVPADDGTIIRVPASTISGGTTTGVDVGAIMELKRSGVFNFNTQTLTGIDVSPVNNTFTSAITANGQGFIINEEGTYSIKVSTIVNHSGQRSRFIANITAAGNYYPIFQSDRRDTHSSIQQNLTGAIDIIVTAADLAAGIVSVRLFTQGFNQANIDCVADATRITVVKLK